MADIKIYKPSKTAMSSGKAKTKKWVIKFDESSKKYQEGLMGWTGTQDTRYQMKLQFETLEDAIAYAEKMGWTYDLQQEQENTPIIKSYGDNFSPYRVKG